MSRSKVPEHECSECDKPTTNLFCCSRDCITTRMRRVGSFRTFPPPEPVETKYMYNALCGLRETDCWGWLGHFSTRGAPMVWEIVGEGKTKKKRQIRAQRISWTLFKGPIPDGHIVGVTCGNLACSNPRHLRCGKQGEIVGPQLRLTRAGARFGDSNKNTRLPDVGANLIRKLYREGRKDECWEVCRRLAEKYDMSYEYLRSVARTKKRYRKAGPEDRRRRSTSTRALHSVSA